MKKKQAFNENMQKVFIGLAIVVMGLLSILFYNSSTKANLLKNIKVSTIAKVKETQNYIKIKGENPEGKIAYFFTDPNCPACKNFEKNNMESALKSLKELNVVYNPLAIRGHEDSYDRAAMVLSQYNDKMSTLEVLSLMAKYSLISKEEVSKEVSKVNIKKEISKVKSFTEYRLVNSTPTLLDSNGEDIMGDFRE